MRSGGGARGEGGSVEVGMVASTGALRDQMGFICCLSPVMLFRAPRELMTMAVASRVAVCILVWITGLAVNGCECLLPTRVCVLCVTLASRPVTDFHRLRHICRDRPWTQGTRVSTGLLCQESARRVRHVGRNLFHGCDDTPTNRIHVHVHSRKHTFSCPDIAESGYTFEQFYAFYPLYHYLTRYIAMRMLFSDFCRTLLIAAAIHFVAQSFLSFRATLLIVGLMISFVSFLVAAVMLYRYEPMESMKLLVAHTGLD